MSDYICKRTWISSPIKPRYDMLILNSAIDYEEPILTIGDRINTKEYRFTLQMIIGMAKKEGLINGN